MIVITPEHNRTTVSYPRFLYEKSIGRILRKGEDIHHKDGDFTNNELSNLEIKDHAEHCREHRPGYSEQTVTCVYCGKTYTLTGKQVSNRKRDARRNKRGPFCSRRCSGKYGQELQMSAKGETP